MNHILVQKSHLKSLCACIHVGMCLCVCAGVWGSEETILDIFSQMLSPLFFETEFLWSSPEYVVPAATGSLVEGFRWKFLFVFIFKKATLVKIK